MNYVKSKRAENNDHTKKLSESHIVNKTLSEFNANDETFHIKQFIFNYILYTPSTT